MLFANNGGVCVCAEFQHIMSKPSSSIATISIQKSTKVKREAQWQTQGLVKGKRAPSELMLRQSLKRIFPNEEIFFEVKKAINIKQTDDIGPKGYLEVDASIPRLKFHVEYQDPYHYTSIYYANRPLANIRATDAFKKKYLAERGESLLQLPCWWDGTDESLVATIKTMRPDLLRDQNPSCQPVPETEPDDFLLYEAVPDAGTLMQPVYFNKKYYDQSNVWLGNEKLDGVRCCWNPKRQKLYSRPGKELRFPEEFKQHMLDSFLDGEIWFGRGKYSEAPKLCKTRISVIDWPSFRISVFDIAGPVSTQMTYGARYKILHSIITNGHPFLFIPLVIQIKSEEQRFNFERLIANNNGEGMILTEMNSLYVHGQSSNVLKVKPSLDKEALVVAIDSDHLTLQLTDGTRFRTFIPNIEPPPRVRDVITLSYNRCVQGSTLPVKPQIQRVRGDMTWSEVVAAANKGVPQKLLGRDYSTRWDRNLDDLRGYFTKFAQDNNFDSLVPANWYNVDSRDITTLPGALNMLKPFNGVINALITSFPDIGLDVSMFSKMPRDYWKDVDNIKKWFDQFATQKGFDPLVADNWYFITRNEILDIKGGNSLTTHFGRSHIKALFAAYPEIGLDESMFSTVPSDHWKDIYNIRQWFDQFSKQKGFDPLVAHNWYSITLSDILDKKGGSSLIMHLGKSHMKALVAAYPEIGLDESKIHTVRKWFDQFAQQKRFDPLIAHNWYSITRGELLDEKGGNSLFALFGWSHMKALIAAYPEIGLDESMFSTEPYGYWNKISNVRKWFNQFANQKGFNPLIAHNWYFITCGDILDRKGGNSLATHFGKSHIKALIAAYPEIGLDESMFSTVPYDHWKDFHNVRKWFDQFAKQKGFDPLVADNWYTVTHSEIWDIKGGNSLTTHFGGSLIEPLVSTYPEIGLDKSMLPKVPHGYWKDIGNVTAWFDQFAKQKGFDPLVAHNWYSITQSDILDKKGVHGLIAQFSGSHMKALIAAYPEIGLDESMFSTVPNGYWKDVNNIRKWFDQFAKQKGFDPLVAHNWYSIKRGDILDKKGGNSFIVHFGRSHMKALVAAYPEIGLDESMFSAMPFRTTKRI